VNNLADSVVPQSFGAAIRAEFLRAIHPPYGAPFTALINGILAAAGFWLLPPSLKDQLFSIQRPLAFAIVLASWMYSDVPATNVLGETAALSLAALDDPLAMRRIIVAKNIVLWSIVSPLCIAVSLWMGIKDHNLLLTGLAAIWIAVVPFAALSFSSWMGILFPYHPLSLRQRFEACRLGSQKRRHFLWRWLALVLLPYVIVPALAIVLLSPVLLVWHVSAKTGMLPRGRPKDFFAGIAVSCALSALWMWLGRLGALHLIAKRRHSLRDYLSDPSRG